MATPEQLHELLTYCLSFGRQMLARSGTFYPFGAVLNAAGEVEARGAYDGNEHPNPGEIYQLLEGAFMRDAHVGSITAFALAANVNVPPSYESPFPDAVRVKLEAPGYSRFVYLPYRLGKKSLFGRRSAPAVAEPFAVELAPSTFQ
jgi:hypothetical protein